MVQSLRRTVECVSLYGAVSQLMLLLSWKGTSNFMKSCIMAICIVMSGKSWVIFLHLIVIRASNGVHLQTTSLSYDI
jgi:hypothetical protein